MKVRRALISVYDKSGIVEFAKRLAAQDVELVSSGGTAAALGKAGITVTPVARVTGAPEMLGGRVKTLHPAIHGAILARPDNQEDRNDLGARGIEPFQMVVVNLYPFAETVARPDSTRGDIIEKIDIGGPAMIRAAAKNHDHVAVVTDPGQYEAVAAAVEGPGLDDELRQSLAADAFLLTAAYDAAIVEWMGGAKMITMRAHSELRYGENPHQEASLYLEAGAEPWWAVATQHQGKAMSFNNYADTEAAWRLAIDLPPPSAVVVKHMNPAGVATADTLADAFAKAWSGDSLAAFGGVVASNAPLDETTAVLISDKFVEVVIAPSADPVALEILARKKNLRVITSTPPERSGLDYRRIAGGFLVQDRDQPTTEGWSTASRREPTPDELAELQFAWVVAAHVKSNAIVLSKDRHAVGVGAGDQSRVGAAERAIVKAGRRAEGSVAASDAFFPFRDGIDVLAREGVTAIVEPGGSMRDDEVIEAANEHDIALVFTGRRHFRH